MKLFTAGVVIAIAITMFIFGFILGVFIICAAILSKAQDEEQDNGPDKL